MKLRNAQNIQQDQRLNLSMSMRDSLWLLSLSNTSLHEVIASEIAENPFIIWTNQTDASFFSGTDFSSPDRHLNTSSNSCSMALYSFEGGNYGNINSIPEPDQTLQASLTKQLRLETTDPRMKEIGEYLIDQLDQAGYLAASDATICKELDCSDEELACALKIIQSLEPTGIGARNLKECLYLQLADEENVDHSVFQILDYLELIAQRNWEALRKITGLSQNIIQQAIKKIIQLDPKPGLQISGKFDGIREPDAFVLLHENGQATIQLNANIWPHIKINEDILSGYTHGSKADQKELSVYRIRAQQLLTSLKKRSDTISLILDILARDLNDFFFRGWKNLKPLSQSRIAAELELHESTVSRAIAHKTLLTSFGLFEIKTLLSSSDLRNGNSQTDAISARAVAEYIKTYIQEEENTGLILSDQEISEKLAAEDIIISRRTVAKYRRAMNISASHRRKICLKVQDWDILWQEE